MIKFTKINNFDLIRLFAAIQVFIYHMVTHFKLFQKNDYLTHFISQFPGVPIFFFISGFLITASYQRNQNKLKVFYKNRLKRIYPALWVCFGLTLLILFLFDQLEFKKPEFYIWIVSNLTFFQYYTPSFLRDWGIGNPNGSLWSIVVELQFYLILPGICIFLNKLKSIKAVNFTLLVISIFAILLSVFLDQHLSKGEGVFDMRFVNNHRNLQLSKILAISVFKYLHFFGLGIFFYYNFHTIYKFVENKALLWIVIYLGYILMFTVIWPQFHGLYLTNVYSIVAIIILAFTTFSIAFSNIYLSEKLLTGNDLSYGIYIYHMLVINCVIELNIKNTLYKTLISIFFVIILAIFSWKYIEKNALKYKLNG